MQDIKTLKNKFGELTELHVHVGSAVAPPIMWEIAHDQGIKLPTKNYWEFEKLITVPGKITYEKKQGRRKGFGSHYSFGNSWYGESCFSLSGESRFNHLF